MNLGQLDPENEEFIKNYKELGYSTKTQLANEAIAYLRLRKKEQLRMKWRTDAFAEIADANSDLVFEALDGEDFVNKAR
ncbi:MAG: hypothetical protein WCI18_14435 [Pseudomonadota bacterium]